MLTRLADRYEDGPDGQRIRIIRYGKWGTTSEIEKRGRKYVIVHKNGKEKKCKSLEEAEVYLTK